MNTRVAQLGPDFRQEDQDLLLGQSETAHEQPLADSLQVTLDVRARPEPDLLVLGVLGPRVDGPLEDLLLDVGEAAGLEAVEVADAGVEGAAELVGCLDEVFVPLVDGGVGLQGAVVAAGGEDGIDDLDPAAGVEEAVGYILAVVMAGDRLDDGTYL